MKNKYISLLLILLVSGTMITGCGKESGADQVIKELEESGDRLSEQDKEEITEAYNEIKEQEETSKPVSNEAVEYKLYDKISDWGEDSIYYGAFQLDDIYYEPLMNLDDLMSRISSSDVKYEYEYNPDYAMSNNDVYEIKLLRDGNAWITIMAKNLTGADSTAKEAILANVSIFEDARKYAYLCGGIAYDNIIGMSIDELTAMVNENYPDCNMYDKTSGDKITENIIIDPIRLDSYSDGQAYQYSVAYQIIVDKNTNVVVDEVYSINNIHMTVVETEDITDFASLSDQDKEAIKNYCIETIKKDSTYGDGLKSAEILGDYHESSSGGHAAIGYVTVVTMDDGSVKYINQRLLVSRDVTGNIQCSGDFIAFDDEEQAIKMIDLK